MSFIGTLFNGSLGFFELGLATATTEYTVSASNSLGIGTTPSYIHSGSIFITASNSVGVHASASFTRDLVRLASNSIDIEAGGSPQFIGSIFVDAANSFGVRAVSVTPSTYRVSASNSVRASQVVSYLKARSYLVSAHSGIWIWDHAPAYKSPILLSASSGISLTGTLSGVGIGLKYVTASTAMTIGQKLTYTRLAIYRVSASNGFKVATTSKEVRDAVLTASSSFSVGAMSRQARDIHVSAATGLGLSLDNASNEHYILAASNSFSITVSAGSLITGTLASNSFKLVQLAQATVSLPWRPAGLALPPGGGLPHS